MTVKKLMEKLAEVVRAGCGDLEVPAQVPACCSAGHDIVRVDCLGDGHHVNSNSVVLRCES